jgi:16S rRNA (guanine527-N7)-methyltransferase
VQVTLEQLVSKETLEKFKIYEGLLAEWNQKIDLVQQNTIANVRLRHIIDSLQIIPIIADVRNPDTFANICIDVNLKDKLTDNPMENIISNGIMLDCPEQQIAQIKIIDIGTGAGFPGMVLAICGYNEITLCESNVKKCVFLEEVSRQTGTKVHIRNQRIETISDSFDIVTSRAFSEMNKLMELMNIFHRDKQIIGIFPKGASWFEDMQKIDRKYIASYKIYKSFTDRTSAIISVKQ